MTELCSIYEIVNLKNISVHFFPTEITSLIKGAQII